MEAKTISSLREYLEWTVNVKKGYSGQLRIPSELKFVGLEDLVLQHGIECKPQLLPAKYKRGKIKECFNNALDLATRYPAELTYVEGFASGLIATHHAWCIDKNRNVIENTWPDGNGKEYFGIPLKLKWVIDTVCKKKTYGVLENWEQDFPLLTGKVDIEKVKEKV